MSLPPAGCKPKPTNTRGAKRVEFKAEIGEQALRLSAQKLATDFVVRAARAFEHRYRRAVPGKFHGKSGSGESPAQGNEGWLLHREKFRRLD